MTNLPGEQYSRSEEFLNAIATGDIADLPEPQSRNEIYLDYIAKNRPVGELTPVQVENVNNIPQISSQLETIQNQVDNHIANHPSGGGGSSDVTKAYVDTQDTKLQNQIDGIKTELRTNRFVGKKIIVEGDSITEKNSRADKNWHDYLASWLGFGEVVNKAVSGTGFVNASNGAVSRVPSYPVDSDLILLMGCMNDLQLIRDNKLGTFEDATNETFYGGLHIFFETLLEKFPNTPIMLITSQPRGKVEDNPSYLGEKRWGKNCPAYQLNEALKEVAEHYAIPTYDLYSSSFVKPWLTSNRNRLCPDGVHPNTEGQYVMANQILNFITSVWLPSDDFTQENIPLRGIEMNKSNATIEIGELLNLDIIPTPLDATNRAVVWTTDNNSTIDLFQGTVTGKAEGTAIVTATSLEGGYTTTCTITVVGQGQGQSIITDGLVSYLDAIDNQSISTTWVSKNGGLSGTISGGTPTYNTTTKSIKFDFSQICTITNSVQVGGFTAEILIPYDTFATTNTIIPFANYTADALSGGIGLIIRSSTLEISDRIGATVVIGSTTKESYTENYVLISVTVDTNKLAKLYVNGVLKGSGNVAGFSSNDFIVRHKSMTASMNISSFRLYNKALTQLEIQNNLECEKLIRTF